MTHQPPVQHAPPQRPQPYREPSRPGGAAPPPRRAINRPAATPPPPSAPPRPRRKRHWGRRIGLTLLVLLLLIGGGLFYLDRQLHRTDALADYPDRVGDTPGTNWLLVGSDSRNDLSPQEQQDLATGGDVGNARTDTIILIHIPKSGRATMVSIPRDSYVSIPGNGKDKINASFAIGGAPLLVQTLETATGLHIDHYAEIGFGGFASVVDAVGGLDMCLDQPLNDPLAGINLAAGCQHLNGAQALGYVRSRAFASADLERMQHQRQFMSALLKKVSSASTLLNPFRIFPLLGDAAKSLQVDNGDHIWNLLALAWAMHGSMITTTVPIGGFENTSGSGNVLLWDRPKAQEFFSDLAADQPLPADLISSQSAN
ncbi:LytR family transcriptional regulator [Skermania sp. ID1734]|nr:LytR family transcriptional regulator [Skermania sp. ID1734]